MSKLAPVDMSTKRACQLMPSPDFLSEAEFVGEDGKYREFDLAIAAVTREELQLPGRSGLIPKIVVAFEGAKKRLVLNKTNASAIKSQHGGEVANWLGKKITLFYNPGVRMGREVVGGVRVRGK